MRQCQVVLRKAQGTDWPPVSIDHRGTSVSLDGVFNDAGLALELVRVESDLSALPSGRPFEPADLRAALASTLATVASPEGSWTAVALIVPEILDRVGGRSRYPLGLMFGGEDGAREGCAVASRRLRSGPTGYLRTLLHELGHIFNLAHPGEGPEPFGLDALNTLMVPTDRLRPSGEIEFRFPPGQRDWLANGPEPYVRPGGLPFGARPPGWAPRLEPR